MRHHACLLSMFFLGCSTSDDGSDPIAGDETDASTSDLPGAGTGGETHEPPETTNGSSPASESSDTGDDPTGDDDSTSDGSEGDAEPGPDLRLTGPHGVETDTGQLALGCTMAYTRFAPQDIAPGGTVILAHGFQGNRASMAGWAEHLASWGLEVVTPDLCHATIFDSNHAQNGADLVALRQHLRLDAVVYAGYSAGGLAAFLAAADDPAVLAVLGLDPVDNDDLGAMAASRVQVPAHAIVAEPDMCNSAGNGIAVFDATPMGRVLRVTEADHCNFQNPGDALCGLCSSSKSTWDDATIQATIIGLATGSALWQTQVDETGQQWWLDGGPWFEQLTREGIVGVVP